MAINWGLGIRARGVPGTRYQGTGTLVPWRQVSAKKISSPARTKTANQISFSAQGGKEIGFFTERECSSLNQLGDGRCDATVASHSNWTFYLQRRKQQNCLKVAPSTSNSDGDENRGDLAIRSIEFHRKSHRLISLLLRNSPLLTLPSSPNNHFSGSTMQPIIDFNAQAFVCEAQVITWMRTRFNQISGLCVPPWCSSLCMVLPALRQMSLFNTYTGIPICMSCCTWYSEYLVPGTLCLPGTLVPALSLSTPV